MAALVARFFFGERPQDDPEFEAALDQALSKEKERERRLESLQERLDVIQRR